MSKKSAGERAISLLEIEDVFVVSSVCHTARDFNQTDRGSAKLVSVHRVRVDQKMFVQARIPENEPHEKFQIVRYFVEAEVQIGRPGAEATKDDEIAEEVRLASLLFVFAVDYRCKEAAAPDVDALSAFSQNAAFHAWPYWRESVHAACARMRLPAVTVPMFKQSTRDKLQQDSAPAVTASDEKLGSGARQ